MRAAWWIGLVACSGSDKVEDGTDDVDTDVADTDVADTDVVDTDVVDTDAMDTDAADTDVADTDAADTDGTDDTDAVVPDDTLSPVVLWTADFEMPAFSGPGSYDGLTPLGWTRSTDDGSMTEGTFRPLTGSVLVVEPLAAPAHGLQCAVIGGGAPSGSAADARHELRSGAIGVVTSGQTYAASAAVAARRDVWSSFVYVGLVADGVVVAEAVRDQRGIVDGVFAPLEVTWVADPAHDGAELSVRIGLELEAGSGVLSAVFDNVVVTED